MVSKHDISGLFGISKSIERCPRCGRGPMVIDTSGGELACSSCGLVIKEKLEEVGPEWRAFSKEDKDEKIHTGAPSSLAIHDKGLATVIGAGGRDASGRALSSSMKAAIERLRTWDGRSQVYEPADRNLRQAFNELDRLSDKLNLSDVVVEKAAYIYRRALERGLIRGRSISCLISASLYAACRDTSTPRTLKDISKSSNIQKKDLARGYRLLVRQLDLKMPVTDPTRCIARIASAAALSERTRRRAFKILKIAENKRTSAGKDPMGLAAAALYVACVIEGENKTQKDVAEAAGVTEVTIRNRYKGLRSTLET